MTWMLDTNVIIHAARARPAIVARRYRAAADDASVREFARMPRLAVEDWTAG